MPVRVTGNSSGKSSSSSHLIPRNVIVAGETGVGKSSFINLVTGTDSATTANDVCGVTTRTCPFDWETDTQLHAFRLWDTPGLGEGAFGSVSPKAAQHALRSLFQELSKEGGVHLLVLCMRGLARITKGMKQTYDIIQRIRDQVSPQIPIVAVITELEKRCNEANIVASMEDWWTSNESALAAFDMAFCGHACLTTLLDDCHPQMPGRHAKCQRLARNLLIDHALPLAAFGGSLQKTDALSSLSVKLTCNIVVVGETGVGKSSVINLVVGADSAVAASDVRAVTVGTSYHDWHLSPTQTFRLWDTPGLGEGPLGSSSSKHAHSALQALLTELGKGAGIHLLIVCFRGGRRVTKSMKQTYDTVLALRDRVSPDTPLIAVITELERKSDARDDVLAAMDQWWYTNANTVSGFHMSFTAHACITTLSDDAHPPIPGRRDECQRLVRDLIIDNALTPRSTPAQDIHVILFGETGVGKSSLVNLLAGWDVADISPDSVACTLASTEYQFQLGPATIRLWDTVGLEEPERGANGYMGAIEKAAELIQRLNASGGISLFLFCIRGSRVTTTMRSNYRLFYEVLGKRQVPIALAVTHLEREPDMNEWWGRNVKTLEKNGIHIGGHACITTLEGHPKYAESRNAVQDLLWQYADQGKFSMPSEPWLGRLLSGLSALVGLVLPRGKDLIRILTKRCHLEPDVAQKVAAYIETMDM
ncbi:P-loop containing nucleoside triphosphate hydrolase protein [Chiua virens]|nr:P-loop containing nucleoside triphosphate hydrolase protein [Chiua virens]